MSILFNRRVSLQVDPIIFNIRKINSKSSQRYLFHPSQVAFVFPPTHPFFFKDSDFLITIHFNVVKSLHSFLSIFLSGDSHEDSNGASSLSLITRFLLRSSNVENDDEKHHHE